MKSLKMKWRRMKMRKSWKMNKLIMKLFVSLTLLLFCELLLLQSIRGSSGSNSRFNPCLYRSIRGVYRSVESVSPLLVRNSQLIRVSPIKDKLTIDPCLYYRGGVLDAFLASIDHCCLLLYFAVRWCCFDWFYNLNSRSIWTKYSCNLLVNVFWFEIYFDETTKITYSTGMEEKENWCNKQFLCQLRDQKSKVSNNFLQDF